MMSPWGSTRASDWHHHNWQRIIRDFVLLATIGITLIALSNATDATDAIQTQRRDYIFQSCRTQNLRHDATIGRLDAELALIARRHPRRAAFLKQRRQFTVDLIDALAPHMNCQALARRSTS